MSAPILIVAGLRASGSGYPNAEQTLRQLQAHGIARLRDLGKPLPPQLHLWKLRGLSPLRQLWTLARLGLGNLLSLLRVLLAARGRAVPVYVPYPSLFFMWLASWLPARLRPRCIVDAYISIWDSMFRDRARGGDSAASRWVRRIEARALRAAAVVLVDTEANRQAMIDDFGLDPQRVRSLPLAIDSDAFLAIDDAAARGDGPLRVLFVGTLIPLHGVPAIVDAVRRLSADPAQRGRFAFRFVGDGQLGPALEAFIAEQAAAGGDGARIDWVRDWQPLSTLAQEIAAADICLGVFGGDGKAARVLPFKLYMYLAAGRAVVSQAKSSLPQGAPPPPLIAVASADGAELARALAALADDPARRVALGRQAREYFHAHLAPARLMALWRGLLAP